MVNLKFPKKSLKPIYTCIKLDPKLLDFINLVLKIAYFSQLHPFINFY